MALIYAGIDEAGYGPRLGPLCVGLSVFRVRDWAIGDPAPDLWALLWRAVTNQRGRDARGRIAIADSKALKLANGGATRHPLTYLERGVLSMLGAIGGEIAASDDALFGALGVRLGGAMGERPGALRGGGGSYPWYEHARTELPLGSGVESLRLDVSMLRGALSEAGVEVLELRCACVCEREFNDALRAGGKGGVVLDRVERHIAHADAIARARGEPLRVVCDRLGGRLRCEGAVSGALSADVRVLEESERCSRYEVGDRAGVQFLPGGESRHLPIALASMIAKFVRELAMIRFNRYWASRRPGVRATAGYWQDANRWLDEMRGTLDASEREALVRRA